MARFMYWISFIVFLILSFSAVTFGLEGQYQEMGKMIGWGIVWFVLWRIWAELQEFN